MKITKSEFGHDYLTYRFGYCEHAKIEPDDCIANLYENGFLPYSADPTVRGLFYMARSARVDLSKFEFSSENRRIGKRFDDIFSFNSLSIHEAEGKPEIRKLFLKYFKERHGENIMPIERFDAILKSPLPLRILSYEKDEKLIAAVLEVTDGMFGHFWFSAYDLSYVGQGLGMWLMLDATRRAKKDGLYPNYYIGTVYGSKALYKTNLEPLEFWTGSSWSSNLAKLKEIARSESR